MDKEGTHQIYRGYVCLVSKDNILRFPLSIEFLSQVQPTTSYTKFLY